MTRRRLHAVCKSSMRTNAAHRRAPAAVGNDRRQTRSLASQSGDAPSHRQLPPTHTYNPGSTQTGWRACKFPTCGDLTRERDLAALRRMASVQAHELLLMFDQLMPLDRCRLGRSHRTRPISPGWNRKPSEAPFGRALGPRPTRQSAVRPLTAAARRAAVVAPRRPGAASPRICSACRSTGGKALRVQGYEPYRYNLR